MSRDWYLTVHDTNNDDEEPRPATAEEVQEFARAVLAVPSTLWNKPNKEGVTMPDPEDTK